MVPYTTRVVSLFWVLSFQFPDVRREMRKYYFVSPFRVLRKSGKIKDEI